MELFSFFLEVDKQKHIVVSLLLFILIFFIRKVLLKNKGFFRVLLHTIRDVLIIWILKEFFDLLGFWEPDLWDILANSFGIIIAIYIYYLIKESKKLENTNFFKYEKVLINDLKKKLIITWKKLYIITNIKYRQLFFKKELLLRLENKQEIYNLSQSFRDLYKIFKYFISLSCIWSINLIILLVKIPFIALFDTVEIFSRIVSYSYWLIKRKKI